MVSLGSGIPSGIVLLLTSSGEPGLLIGCGGAVCPEDPVPGGMIVPLYWRHADIRTIVEQCRISI